MAEEIFDSDKVRDHLLELLGGDECNWRFTERATREGKLALHGLNNQVPSELEVVDYIISALKSKALLRCSPQGNPPGST